MLEIKKIDDNTFHLIGAGKTLKLSRESYEDLFYAVPPEDDKYLNEAALYRLFTDSIFEDDEERKIFLEMLKTGTDQESTLKQLQNVIKKLEP